VLAMYEHGSAILVLGIGNTLLTDDGAGVQVARQLQAAAGADLPALRVLDAGTMGFALLPEVQDCAALIVVDAARESLAPGTVTVRESSEMDRFLSRRGRSVHEVGIADLLDMARLSGSLPARRALIGIEPAVVDWGLECTPAVAAAVPRAAARVLALIAQWRSQSAAAEAMNAA
jgi:hydrogenase maturation protease